MKKKKDLDMWTNTDSKLVNKCKIIKKNTSHIFIRTQSKLELSLTNW